MSESKKWYCYRNEHGMEIKSEHPLTRIFLKEGYKLMKVVDYSVSAKEKKCK